MILVGPVDNARRDLHGYGPFHTAVYDDDGAFLGCVKYSRELFEYTDDRGFRVARVFAVFLVITTTIATLLSVFVQCFSKSGKSCLWKVMGWSYAFALACQGIMYSVWSTEICEGSSTCKIGPNGIAAIFNSIFLVGMVVACYQSLPPRNPVFRLWNIIPTEYETDNFESDDDRSDPSEANSDPENPRPRSSRLEKIREYDDENDAHESVSLFSNQKSRRSGRSDTSGRSGGSNRSGKLSSTSGSKTSARKNEDSSVTSARKKSATSNSDAPTTGENQSILSGSKGGLTSAAGKTGSVAGRSKKSSTSRALDKIECEDVSVSTGSQKGSLSSGSNKGYGASRSQKSSRSATVEKNSASSIKSNSVKRVEPSGSVTFSKPEPAGSIKSSGKTQRSDEKSRSTAGSTHEELLGGDALADYTTSAEESTEKSSQKGGHDGSVKSKNTMGSSIKTSKSKRTKASTSTGTVDAAKFLKQLKASTVLEQGGIRIRETSIGQKLEIVDEYPATNINGVHPPHDFDGTDIVRVRTEYYPEGRKTIKEELHHDGSRTISTLIEPMDDVDEEIEVDLGGSVQ